MTIELISNDNKAIIQWGYNYLSSHGYTLKNLQPEAVQNTPWSYVVRFLTSDGYIYLKQTPKLLALEANIIQIFREQFHAPVPKIIAHNPELHGFLMEDAGKTLREILKQQFDTELFCKAILQFTSMQVVIANHINTFLDIGVPDWRLAILPDLYMQLLAKTEILIADGLSKNEIRELKKLLPTISHLCEKLSDYAIKESFVQPDFNDNNTLIDTSGNITIIDIGEIVISHPFFSLINCLHQVKKHHNLSEKDNTYVELMNACFKNFINIESKKNFIDAYSIAKNLWFIYGALANDRLMTACDKSKFTSNFHRHGRVIIPLKELMAACKTIN